MCEDADWKNFNWYLFSIFIIYYYLFIVFRFIMINFSFLKKIKPPVVFPADSHSLSEIKTHNLDSTNSVSCFFLRTAAAATGEKMGSVSRNNVMFHVPVWQQRVSEMFNLSCSREASPRFSCSSRKSIPTFERSRLVVASFLHSASPV